jgi:hypothetical protein
VPLTAGDHEKRVEKRVTEGGLDHQLIYLAEGCNPVQAYACASTLNRPLRAQPMVYMARVESQTKGWS